jgi:tetratricopeptide (TPR) repeat protein
MCGVPEDWFRTAAWDDAAQQDFEQRLRRSREQNRPQYLRIKAIALRDAGEIGGARQLLERVLYGPGPYANQELPTAHELLGDLARATKDWPAAERHYRQILREWPELHDTTGAIEVSLADVLSRRDDPASRAEALSLLEAYLARDDDIQWTLTLFEWHLVRIRLAEHDDDLATARASARAALDLADEDPQVAQHPSVGTVPDNPKLFAELKRLAATGK